MDAIKTLARLAAMEKVAAPPVSLVGKGLSLLGRLGRTTAPLVSKPLATGARQFSPGRALASGAAGVTGVLGTKDAVNGATGGWTGEDNLGWHRQLMQGQDFNAPAGGAYSPTAWGRTLYSPLKSVMSLGAPEGPQSIQGSLKNEGGYTQHDPSTGQQEIVGGRTFREQTFSPQVKGKLQRYNQSQQQYEQLESAHKTQLQAERDKLDAGSYGGGFNLFGGDANAQRAAQQAKIQKLEQEHASGNYGGSWLGQNASHYRGLADSLAPELRTIGALGRQVAGHQSANLPSTPEAGPLNNDYSYLNYGM